MPIALVRSISLPNLKIYTACSLLLVSGCLYYAFDVVRTDPQWKLHYNSSQLSSSRPSSLLKSSNDAISALTSSDLLSSLTSSLAATEEKDDHDGQHEGLFDETGFNDTTISGQLKDVVSFMFHEPVCIWVSWKLIATYDTVRGSFCAVIGDDCDIDKAASSFGAFIHNLPNCLQSSLLCKALFAQE